MSFAFAGGPRPRVCFLFIGHRHQILHGVSIAAAMSLGRQVEVHVAGATQGHLDDVRRLSGRLGTGRITYHRLWPEGALFRAGRSVPPKAAVLALNLDLLRRFDAIVTPERTSLMLKAMGLRRQIFIHTDHGAGDRAVGYEPRIAAFDLVLLAGEKQRERMARTALIRPGGYAVVGYSKFDVVDALAAAPPRLFAQDRPVVLYNPHFQAGLSSWPDAGLDVLRQFAASKDYNLIFAPHLRLFDGASRTMRRALEPFRAAPNIHVDLGGRDSCDMTYTNMADVYLGDVSSQVYEFIRTPRPCLFLNLHRADWWQDENYAHWRLGPVLSGPQDLIAAVDAARLAHAHYRPVQAQAFDRTFDRSGRASEQAAHAIAAHLAAHAPGVSPGPSPWPAPAPTGAEAARDGLQA
jgi:hypothetical protein